MNKCERRKSEDGWSTRANQSSSVYGTYLMTHILSSWLIKSANSWGESISFTGACTPRGSLRGSGRLPLPLPLSPASLWLLLLGWRAVVGSEVAWSGSSDVGDDGRSSDHFVLWCTCIGGLLGEKADPRPTRPANPSAATQQTRGRIICISFDACSSLDG